VKSAYEIRHIYPSVCLPVRKYQRSPTGRIFVEFEMGTSKKLVDKIQI